MKRRLKPYAVCILAAFLPLAPVAHASETECNRLAIYQDEGGVSDKDFDALNALLVCKPAADAAPDNAELHMLTARAYIALDKGKEAVEYLGKAANKGSWRAQLTLYDWATRKPPILPQTDEVKIQLLTAAAKSGPPRTGLLLVLNYVEGRHTKKDLGKAATLAKGLADKGSPVAMRMYAQLIDGGAVAGANKAEARTWLEKAANAGDAEAMSLLGGALLNTSDYKKGFNWLKKAADLNHYASQKMVIDILQNGAKNIKNGNKNLKPNKRLADRTLKEWASKDFLFALATLGQDHTEKGLASGPEYVKRAFDAGHVNSGWFLVKHYNKKKDRNNTQKWLDLIWDKGDLRIKADVLDFYNREKDLAGFYRAFARMEAELLKQDPIEGHFVAAQILSGRFALSGLQKYWKAAEKNIALYMQKGGTEAAAKVANLLFPHVEKLSKYYTKAKTTRYDHQKYNQYYGPMFKSMYETLIDIVLTENVNIDRRVFSQNRKSYSDAVDTAMNIHNRGLRKVSESNNFAAFLRRGYAPDCGKVPWLTSDNANAAAVKDGNTRFRKWRDCIFAKFEEATKREGDLGLWRGYRETDMGFEDYRLKNLHNQNVSTFKKKITDDNAKLNNAIMARNERIAKK